MPSCYSSAGSVDDSAELARNLGIKTVLLPISEIMKTYQSVLEGPFHGLPADVTEENIQSRIRGNPLMGLSNKFGALLLTTGNKIGNVGRVLHAIWRYERRVGGDRRSAENDGLPHLPLAEPQRAGYSRSYSRQGALGRTASGADRSGQLAALRGARSDSGATYRTISIGARYRRQRLRFSDCGARVAPSTHSRVQAQAGRASLERTSRPFGLGWRMPIARQ